MKAVLIGGALLVAAALAWVIVQGDDGERMSPKDANGTTGTETTGSARSGPLADVTVPETLSAKASTGKTYYDSVCSACHGADGAGQDGVAPPLVHVIYEPSHHGDAAFLSAARNGVTSHHWPFGNMPPVEERMTDGELAAIVAYVRELQRASGIN